MAFYLFSLLWQVLWIRKPTCVKISDRLSCRVLFGANSEFRNDDFLRSHVPRSGFQLKRVMASSNSNLNLQVLKDSKHDSIVLALPSKLFTIHITICMDVHPNPGPTSSIQYSGGL